MPVNFSKPGAADSILSDYMTTIFLLRHFGKDSRNLGSTDCLSLPFMALDIRVPADMSSLRIIG